MFLKYYISHAIKKHITLHLFLPHNRNESSTFLSVSQCFKGFGFCHFNSYSVLLLSPKNMFYIILFLSNFFNFNFICIHFCIKTFLRATAVTKLKTVSHGNICICMPFCPPWCIFFLNKNKFIESFSLTHTCALIPEVLHLQEKWQTLVYWLTPFL